ncbi:hypothetical protein E8E13_000978 [Curvularia kusanoi]|uniref:Uncharacterized protein n=1 Tax=Curvularia kusanoi TaxID=90978 RepID=A0A9P4W350_CURKU|nr:hypothetical protein E8E13_000978 [Curvularia kusanoi]
MSNRNTNDPERNSNRPEDNPFIAFRRYADSQVSSLLNTVFTLPAQIAHYSNAHHAREQCLFGKADPQKCEELQALDARTDKLRHEGTESFRAGDVEAVLKKSEQLMLLERQAGELRRAILIESDENENSAEQQKQLVERVANKKGHEWSDIWDWPEAVRDEEQDDTEFARWLESRARRAGGEIERMLIRLEEDASKVFGEEMEELRKHWAARYDERSQNEETHPRSWSRAWSWQWPPPADARKYTESNALEDPYSPAALEADERTKHMGSLWRNAFEDLMQTTQEHPLLSEAQNTQLDQMGLYSLRDYQKELLQEQDRKRRLLSPQYRATEHESNDEPSYEYAHDHEDQHDDPPTPKPQQTEFPKAHSSALESKQNTETELDVYEQLLQPSSASPEALQSKSKILSTLTTTERTTASDGTVTTKVVLKKRFADGSEQSSETVHTQRGENSHQTGGDWEVVQQASDATRQREEKKGGWFWSS